MNGRLRHLVVASIATAAMASTVPAHATVLYSAPKRQVCVHDEGAVRIGYWFQEHSGGSRRVNFRVRNPEGDIYRATRRATTQWRYFRFGTVHVGVYRIKMSGPDAHGSPWSVTMRVRSVRC